MDVHELMFELSHPGRLEALRILSQKPHRLTDISKALNLTTAEISRHLGRLSKARLITKHGDGRYSLTPFGGIILQELDNLRFVTKHNRYFSTHDFSVIPEDLRWLNAISNCELVEGTLEIMSIVEDLTKNAKKHVRIISDQPMRSIVSKTVQKAKKGVDFKIIYPEDVKVPNDYRLKNGTPIEVRLMDEVRFSMKSNEKIAGIVLPDLDGKIDYEFALVRNKPQFVRWSELLFDYFWQRAESAL